LGTPIAFIIENADTRSQDYSALKDLYRPGHADFTYQAKYDIVTHGAEGEPLHGRRSCVSSLEHSALNGYTPKAYTSLPI